MKDIERRPAGIAAALIAVLVIIFVYSLFATVDLVFMKGENEVCYLENVRVFSDIAVEAEDIKGGKELEFTYVSNGVTKDYNADFEFRIEIVKTVLVNFFTFKWQESDNVIVLHAK